MVWRDPAWGSPQGGPALVSGYLLSRRLHGMGGQRLSLTLIKAGFASLVMGVVAALLLPSLSQMLGRGAVSQLLVVSVSGGLSVGIFLVMSYILRIEELRWLGEMVGQRLRGR